MWNKFQQADILAAIRRQQPDKQWVFVSGCFDLIHPGHALTLYEAKELGDYLIVGLNSDASVKRLKGDSRPIIPEAGRGLMLAALECVDYVTMFDDDTPAKLIEALQPIIHYKGTEENKYQGYSTTGIIERIKTKY